MLGNRNILAFIFCGILASSSLLGELTHDHSHELFDEDHQDFEFHYECINCTFDQVSTDLEFGSKSFNDSTYLKTDYVHSITKNSQSYFLSRAPPQ